VAVLVCLAGLTASLLGCGKKNVATVNGVAVTQDELVAQLQKDYGHEVLSRLINRMLINQAFEKAGLQFPQAKVEEDLKQAREAAGSPEAFQQQLAMSGQTEESLRLNMEMGLKVKMLAEKDIKVTDEVLKAYYKENELRYDLPVRVTFSEIVLPTKKQADDVYAMAAKPKASFADLAKQYSMGVTAQMGGRRPTTPLEQVEPLQVRDEVAALAPNAVTRPIKVEDIYVVLVVHERLPAKKQSFDEARKQVEEDFRGEKAVPQEQLFQQLQNASSVRVLDPRYADLQRFYLGADLLRGAPKGAGPEAGKAGPGEMKAPAAPPAEEPKAEPKTGG
jgi:foldase protein PrsA